MNDSSQGLSFSPPDMSLPQGEHTSLKSLENPESLNTELICPYLSVDSYISMTESEDDVSDLFLLRSVLQLVSFVPSQRNCNTHTATSEVVGPTTAELESINELIKFDHVYYKHESSAVESGLEKLDQNTQSSNANLENKVNIHITQEITDDIEIDNIMKTEPDLCAINEIDETDRLKSEKI
jgi:hypothetical protein